MKGRTILLDEFDGREAAALVVDGQLEDFLIASGAPAPGTVYRARADRPVKGQGGMFLSGPDGQLFLRQVKGLAAGQPVLVQVTGYAEEAKAAPVTTRLMFKSRYVIVTPGAPGINVSRQIRDADLRSSLQSLAETTVGPQGAGLILRSSCEGADPQTIAEDVARMSHIARQIVEDTGTEPERLLDGDGPHALAWREWTTPAEMDDRSGAFERHGVPDLLDAARAPAHRLPAGANLFVEPTRALVAVDVNTGRDTTPAAGLKANLACARTLPRLLRVRGLGGQIVIDMAPMPKKDRRQVETALRASFRSDPVETTLAGWTPLGHFELQRARARALLDPGDRG